MQAYTLRRHYLPQSDDSEESLAQALWLNRHHQEALLNAVTNGIGKAFSGG